MTGGKLTRDLLNAGRTALGEMGRLFGRFKRPSQARRAKAREARARRNIRLFSHREDKRPRPHDEVLRLAQAVALRGVRVVVAKETEVLLEGVELTGDRVVGAGACGGFHEETS
jgi:hypothetical protein